MTIALQKAYSDLELAFKGLSSNTGMLHSLARKPNGEQIYFERHHDNWLDCELIAYKIVQKFKKGIIMGLFKESMTHYSYTTRRSGMK